MVDKRSNGRAIAAVLAHWDQWLDGGAGTFAFRVTQVLTGHGCLGKYLYRIGAEKTQACQEAEIDSAQRTEGMPAFPGAAAGIEERHRKRRISEGDRRGTRGKKKREGGHHQILRGGDGHEGDHKEKPENLRPARRNDGVRELELDATPGGHDSCMNEGQNTTKPSRRRKRM